MGKTDMLPIIDYTQIQQNDTSTTKNIQAGAYDTGFLILKNTPISTQQLNSTFEMYRNFFALPDLQKRRIDMAQTQANRGWGAPYAEQVDPEANPDFKQVFDCGFELAPNDPIRAQNIAAYADNLWPQDPPMFQKVVETYAQHAFQLATKVLQATTKAIGEDPDYFINSFSRPMALLRANYYPPRPGGLGDKDFGIAAHTDYGCITLLATDGTPGLEVQTRAGDWLAITPPKDHFIINFGEMLQMWTNGAIRATPHRVKGSAKERMSIPLFFNPNHDTNVAPLGSNQSIKAQDHLEQRFNDTYVHLKSQQ